MKKIGSEGNLYAGPDSIKRVGTIFSIIIPVLGLLTALATFWVISVTERLGRMQENQYQSYILADELRQSSDDLTRLGRTYVVTGDASYEAQYMDILAIRNGEKPRPENYNRIYWDFVAAGRPVSESSGEMVSLHDLMVNAGFTKQEFDYLSQAQANSDGLVQLEVRAMNAVKGLFADANGDYTITAEPDPKLARELVHSKEYHQFKADIMEPVNLFLAELETRFLTSIAGLEQEKWYAQMGLIAAVSLLFIAAVFNSIFTSRRVLTPLRLLGDAMVELGAGNKVETIPGINKKDEFGTMAVETGKFRDQAEKTVSVLKESVELQESVAAERKQREEMEAKAKAEKEQKELQEKAELAENIKNERAAVSGMNTVVNACADGDFSQRIDVDGKSGALLDMSDGLNRIGEVTNSNLNETKLALQALAKGDLTYRMHGDYPGIFGEISDMVNMTFDNLDEIVGAIHQSSSIIAESSNAIAGSALDLSKRTEGNAAELANTSSSIEELAGMVSGTADISQKTNETISSVSSEANDGSEIVSSAVKAMEKIQKSSGAISKITGVIDDIAFQTNLLALNAGVEAARAGDAGRGFAVVATEVRGLASRSAEAAREISDLISESEGHVNEGVGLVNQTGEFLHSITISIGAASKQVEAISNSSTEQATTINNITKTIQSLDQSTMKNAAMFEETTAASQTLTSEMSELISAVDAFKISGLDHSEDDNERNMESGAAA